MTSKMSDEKLDVLVLAPHPFLINRGTPIDVHLVVQALSERKDTEIDMIVYPQGEDVDIPRVTVYRVPFCSNIQDIRPGFSLKKIYIDFFMLFYTWKKVHSKRYSLIHAGEESVFIAMLMKFIYKIPYIYDIDSSIAQQMVEKMPVLKPFTRIFDWCEGRAIKGALANAPVCHALRELCEKNQSSKTVTLHDISQLKNPNLEPSGLIRKEIQSNSLILLYCGNLEEYQGVDLLVESFPYVVQEDVNVDLVIIGGIPEDIELYTKKAKDLGIEKNVHFLGPRPFDELDAYLSDADILVAPRVKGVNTPMKIFPYMHSGKPVLLTKLYTHTQIVTDEEVYLADANPKDFAAGIVALAKCSKLRAKLGKNGKEFVEKNHVYAAHKSRIDKLYNWGKKQLTVANTILLLCFSACNETLRALPTELHFL